MKKIVVTRICSKKIQEICIPVEEDREYIVEIRCNGVLIRRSRKRPVERIFVKEYNGKQYTYRYLYLRFHIPKCNVIEKTLYGEERGNEYYDVEITVKPA